MNQTNNTPEKTPVKPTLVESVDSLIAKKKSEKDAEAQNTVNESAKSVQGEVAEVMAGVEAPKEKISERNSENKGDGDIKTGGGKSDEDQAAQVSQGIMQYIFPEEGVMIKKVRSAIQTQIKVEEKRAKKLEKNLANGSAQEYNSAIARIRRLKEVLASLFNATVETLKELYKKYFTPRGFRKPLREVDVD